MVRSANNQSGEVILSLLEEFSLRPVSDVIRDLYNRAYRTRIENPGKAIGLCETALGVLDHLPGETLPNKEEVEDAIGRCHLLLASIHLNKETVLEEAEEHYHRAIEAFHNMQWSHLESLTHLGLAVTLRKMGRLKEASDACESAQDKLEYESVPRTSESDNLCEAIAGLRKAIDEERLEIQKLMPPGEEPSSPMRPVLSWDEEELSSPARRIPMGDEGEPKNGLMICDITMGLEIIEKRQATHLHPLGYNDYEKYFRHFPFTRRSLPEKARTADYVLEVKGVDDVWESVSETGAKLATNHLIFVKEELDLERLENKLVAVLIVDREKGKGIQTRATLKTFVHCGDHCLLKRVHRDDHSIVVVSYATDPMKRDYYEKYWPCISTNAYNIAVSGEVVELVLEEEL